MAERPGRVDAAVEIGPPDEEGRRRLFRLYGEGLGVSELSDESLQGAVSATEGRTATYIREVVRRAALVAAERQPAGGLEVDGRTLEVAAQALPGRPCGLSRGLFSASRSNPTPNRPFSAACNRTWASQVRGRRLMGRHGQGPPTPFCPRTEFRCGGARR